MRVEIYEQKEKYTDPTMDDETLQKFINIGSHQIFYQREKEKSTCLSIECENDKVSFTTSYFIGVDWLKENEISCYVKPKMDKDKEEIDYLSMLIEALKYTENSSYLDCLIHINFSKPPIVINQQQDLLSIFLIAMFLRLVKQIVKKGLKKAYYDETDNLDSKVKGKILINKNISKNILLGKKTHHICRYQEFGIDCNENRILKKTISFIRQIIDVYSGLENIDMFKKMISYSTPFFEQVSENISISQIKNYKHNPLFKEYDVAIKYAKLILRRFSYNVTSAKDKQHIATPPFWIDTSKIFELYVYKKLRENFKGDEVLYQNKYANGRFIPDYILKSSDSNFRYIIDAKNKPRYKEKSIDNEDINQVSGYGRLKMIHQELGIPCGQEIKCLIIYPDQECDEELLFSPIHNMMREEKNCTGIFKIGVRLPVKTLS